MSLLHFDTRDMFSAFDILIPLNADAPSRSSIDTTQRLVPAITTKMTPYYTRAHCREELGTLLAAKAPVGPAMSTRVSAIIAPT